MNIKKKAQVLFANVRLLDCPGLYFDVLANCQWTLKKKSPFWLPQVLSHLSFAFALLSCGKTVQNSRRILGPKNYPVHKTQTKNLREIFFPLD